MTRERCSRRQEEMAYLDENGGMTERGERREGRGEKKGEGISL